MAADFVVTTPAAVHITAEGGTAGVGNILGYLSNDGMADFDGNRLYNPLESTDHGGEPADFVLDGGDHRLTLTIAKPDLAIYDVLLANPGSDNQGEAGVIGTRVVIAGDTISVHIIPVASGKVSYVFHRCLLLNDRIAPLGGNVQTYYPLSFRVMRGGTVNELSSGSSATAKYYTKGTTA